MLFILLYVVPFPALFAIALAMPGRRSLLVAAVLLGAPLGWLAFEGVRSMHRAPGGAIVGSAIVTGMIFVAAAGLLSGVITRAVLLRIGRTRRSRMQSVAIVLTGFLAVPSLLAASMWWSNQKIRVPDEACLSAQHHVSIAGADFWLPSAPVFTAWITDKELYSFSSHQRMRAFCSINGDATDPVKLVNLSIDTTKLRYKGPPQRDKFCASSQRDWAKRLCHSDMPTAVSGDGFPEEITVYSPTEYDHKRMLVSDRGAYHAFVKQRDAGILSGQPLQGSQTDDFSRFSNGYWIARDKAWRNDANEPFTLYCYDTKPEGMLYCSTTYRLRSGPQVTYSFRASQNELALASKTVDANFHAFMKDLANHQAGR